MQQGSLRGDLCAIVDLHSADLKDSLCGIVSNGVGKWPLQAEQSGGDVERPAVGLVAYFPLLAAVGSERLICVDRASRGNVSLRQTAGEGRIGGGASRWLIHHADRR